MSSMTFSVQLFLSLTQILRSMAKVENSRCSSDGGAIQGFVKWILLLLLFCARLMTEGRFAGTAPGLTSWFDVVAHKQNFDNEIQS